MRRIVSLWLPQFPVERLMYEARRQGTPLPKAPGQPLALIEAGAKGLRLAACDTAAIARGLKPGERLADARARVPDLASRVHEPDRDAAMLLKLVRWCERWSPCIAPDPPDGLLLDVSGIPHLFGGEAALLADVEAKFRRLGFTAKLALAGTVAAAWALARYAAPFPIIPPGGERAALSALPVEALGLEPETSETLRRLGLKRIGQLYYVPRASLARRFGNDAAAPLLVRLDQALGAADMPLSPMSPQPVFAVRKAVSEPLATAEGVMAITEHLAKTFCRRLEKEGKGALRLLLKLYRVDGSRAVIPAGLVKGSHDPRHLIRLLAPRIEAVDLGFGIEAVTLEAVETVAVAPAQGHFMGGRLASGTELAELADRILNRYERLALVRLEAIESPVPERAEAAVHIPGLPPSLPSPARGEESKGASPTPLSPPLWGRDGEGGGSESPARPLLLLDRPEPILVIAEVPEGPPMRFTWRRVARRVVRAEGPERILPEWWRDGSAKRSRDYYIIEDEKGRRYWLYREGLYGGDGKPAWFVHGLFA